METTELTSVLEDAGLSPYQVEAYVTVLERGAAPATEIAERSDVPGPRIYDVLRALEDRGYVETYEQDTLRVRAHSPETALSDLERRAERFSRAATEIEERWEQPELDSHAASIVGRFETVLDQARTFIREADSQIQLSVTPEQFDSLQPALRTAHENGVNTRISMNTGPEGEPNDLPTETALAATCIEARHRPMPSPFLAIVDRVRVCFAPHAHSANQYGVLVDDRTHAYVFHWYFLSCQWEVFESIHSARPASPPIRYVDIRQCIRDIEPRLAESSVTARIEGHDTETGEEYDLRGTVVDTFYTGGSNDEKASLVQLAGRATLTLDDGNREYTIGGWGAILEPIEATAITVESFGPRA